CLAERLDAEYASDHFESPLCRCRPAPHDRVLRLRGDETESARRRIVRMSVYDIREIVRARECVGSLTEATYVPEFVHTRDQIAVDVPVDRAGVEKAEPVALAYECRDAAVLPHQHQVLHGSCRSPLR